MNCCHSPDLLFYFVYIVSGEIQPFCLPPPRWCSRAGGTKFQMKTRTVVHAYVCGQNCLWFLCEWYLWEL